MNKKIKIAAITVVSASLLTGCDVISDVSNVIDILKPSSEASDEVPETTAGVPATRVTEQLGGAPRMPVIQPEDIPNENGKTQGNTTKDDDFVGVDPLN